MSNHKLKLLRNSMVFYKGNAVEIEVWECQVCKKLMVIDVKRGSRINLNGMVGEEIDGECL